MEASQAHSAGGHTKRGRNRASIALAVVGAVLAVIGVLLLYVREEIIDREAFADHAVDGAQGRPGARAGRAEIVVQLVERGSTDLVAARPLLERWSTRSSTRAVPADLPAGRQADEQVLFVREKSDARSTSATGCRSWASPCNRSTRSSPRHARRASTWRSQAQAATTSPGGTLGDRRPACAVRAVAPLIAVLVLFVAGRCSARTGASGCCAAALAWPQPGRLLAIVLADPARAIAGVVGDRGGDRSGGPRRRRGDPRRVPRRPVRLGAAARAARLRASRAPRPRSTRRRRSGPRGCSGVHRSSGPDRTRGPAGARRGRGGRRASSSRSTGSSRFSVVGMLVGAYLVFFGAGELLVLLGGGGTGHGGGRARCAGAASGARSRVVAVGVGVVRRRGDRLHLGRRVRATGGREPLEGLQRLARALHHRLNEVVFAGTHNSFSAADSPGWFIANQRHTIPRQLQDGIRLFLIDPHWGVEGADGQRAHRLRGRGARDRNKVVKAMPPETLAAAERLVGGQLGGDEGDGSPEVWLCHTVCELGATRMVDSLKRDPRVPRRQPGRGRDPVHRALRQAAETSSGFEEAAGSTRWRDRPRPQRAAADARRAGALEQARVVFTEKDADGTVPWYLDGFSFIQDTPLGATTIRQLQLRAQPRRRGQPAADAQPLGRPVPAAPARQPAFQTSKELISRAHQCARKRGLPVNLIAVDHYDVGDLIPSVARAQP